MESSCILRTGICWRNICHPWYVIAYSRHLSSCQTNPGVRPLPDVPADIPLRLHLLWKILVGIRAKVGADFVLAVKINSSDFVQGGACYTDISVAVDCVSRLMCRTG